jgi:hypothetical protein
MSPNYIFRSLAYSQLMVSFTAILAETASVKVETYERKHAEDPELGGGMFARNIVMCKFNPLTLELNPSAQRCLTRFFNGDLAS